MKRITLWIFCLVFLAVTPVFSYSDINSEIPIPDYDPMWQEFEVMWDNHWDGKNIDDILTLLHKLEKKYSDRIDPYLWLGKCYYMKGMFDLSSREKNNFIAEKYAVKAYEIDNNSLHAFTILIHALNSRKEKAYVVNQYGDWIKKMAPLPSGKLLPDLPDSKEWEEIKYLFKDQENIDKLSLAVSKIEALAEKKPDDALVQMWACVISYYMGEYYVQKGLHQEKGIPIYERSLAYSKKALAINPYDYRIHLWYELALSRKIQSANIFTKAAHLNTLMDHLIFCARENALYDSAGPAKIMGAMIVEGGWVCEKAMKMAGFSVESVINALELSAVLFPDDYFIPYIAAILLKKEKREEEAILSLERNIRRGPPSIDDPDRLRKVYNYHKSQELYERLLAGSGDYGEIKDSF